MLDQGLKAKLPLAVLAFLLGGPMTAHAADLYEGPGPYRSPPPYADPYEPEGGPYAPPPAMRERFGGYSEPCRVFHRVRIDPYGREVLRRVRVCDEPVMARGPGWAAAAPPSYGYGAHFYGMPRPPRAIGPGPEFDSE